MLLVRDILTSSVAQMLRHHCVQVVLKCSETAVTHFSVSVCARVHIWRSKNRWISLTLWLTPCYSGKRTTPARNRIVVTKNKGKL